MEKKTIKIDEKIRDLVESYDYEYNSRKELIAFMLSNNMDINTDAFRKYQKEMQEFLVQFNTAKEEISRKYVENLLEGRNAKWTLDYATCDLTIEFTE